MNDDHNDANVEGGKSCNKDNIDKEQKVRMKRKEAKKQAKKERVVRRKQRLLEMERMSTTFFGKHKWLGGAVDPDTGNIYGIPAHSYQIICITPPPPQSSPSSSYSKAEISTIPLPNKYQQGQYKWLRGLIYNGNLYGIPAWNVQGVLKMELSSKKISVLPLPHEPSYYRTESEPISAVPSLTNDNEKINSRRRNFSSVDRGRWMWHGGAVGKTSDGAASIYAIPSNAQHVLKVSLDGSDKVEEIGPPLSEGQNKFYGGILGTDGCIYGMPYTATGVLRINPRTDDVQILGDFPAGGYKWHGKNIVLY